MPTDMLVTTSESRSAEPASDDAGCRFDPDPARTEAETIAQGLARSTRVDDIGLVRAMRAGYDLTTGRFFAQRAEDTLVKPQRKRASQPHRTCAVRRRGVQLGLVEDRVHVSFPLTALGRNVAAALVMVLAETIA